MADGLNLKDRRVVVTDAAAGLGRVFAEAFIAEGAQVLGADIDGARMEETAHKIGCEAARVDVADPASCSTLANEAAERLGGADAVFNNAALYAGLERRPFEEIAPAVWDCVMAVNVRGTWQMCAAFFPVLRDAGGAIVNVASATVL